MLGARRRSAAEGELRVAEPGDRRAHRALARGRGGSLRAARPEPRQGRRRSSNGPRRGVRAEQRRLAEESARLAGRGMNAHDREQLGGQAGGSSRSLGPECPACGRWAGRPHGHGLIRCELCEHVWTASAEGKSRGFGLDYELACGAEQHDRLRARPSSLLPHELRFTGRRRARTIRP